LIFKNKYIIIVVDLRSAGPAGKIHASCLGAVLRATLPGLLYF